MVSQKRQFNVYVYPADIKRFKKKSRKMGVSQAFLFKQALDMIDASEMGHNESRDSISTPSQTAPIAPRQATKRPARVREGGAK